MCKFKYVILFYFFQVVDGFFVKRVQDVKESTAYLTIMTRYLQKLYQVCIITDNSCLPSYSLSQKITVKVCQQDPFKNTGWFVLEFSKTFMGSCTITSKLLVYYYFLT